MKRIEIKERPLSNCRAENHLKYLVYSDGKLVGEHSTMEIAEQHKRKILTPIAPATYKGKKLI